jgi:hypothetical protein
VAGITTIQYPLRYVHPRSGDTCFVVNILHSINWATVNSHPHLNVRMLMQGSANLESTSHRFLGTAKEKERHAITGRQPDEFPACFRRTKAFCASHDLIEFLQDLNLFVDQQLRITDDVD